MVTKTIKFKDEEWKEIEKMLNDRDISFADLIRESIFNKNLYQSIQSKNQLPIQDIQEIINSMAKQNSETIKFFDSKIKDLERKIELITERTTYAFFKIVAEGKEAIQRLTINDFEIGDILIGHQKIVNVILDIDKEKEEFTITPFPLFKQETRKRSLTYLKEKVGWLLRIDKTKKI